MAFSVTTPTVKASSVDDFAADPAQHKIAKEMAKKGLPLTPENFARQMRLRPNDKDVIKAMIEVHNGGGADAAKCPDQPQSDASLAHGDDIAFWFEPGHGQH